MPCSLSRRARIVTANQDQHPCHFIALDAPVGLTHDTSGSLAIQSSTRRMPTSIRGIVRSRKTRRRDSTGSATHSSIPLPQMPICSFAARNLS